MWYCYVSQHTNRYTDTLILLCYRIYMLAKTLVTEKTMRFRRCSHLISKELIIPNESCGCPASANPVNRQRLFLMKKKRLFSLPVLATPALHSNPQAYRNINREMRDLIKIVDLFNCLGILI